MDQTDELLIELRAWVKQRRGNQTLICRALGLSKQAVSGWVRGEAKPSLESGLKLIAFFKSHKQTKTKQPVE
jgi:predicted XRE-type DNA-binding protein